MPNTCTQIPLHVIFAVKYRRAVIEEEWEKGLFKYIIGIARKRKQRILAINGTSDHVHMLIRMSPDMDISKLVQEIKKASTVFINR